MLITQNPLNRSDLEYIPAPPDTKSYKPIHYGWLADQIKERIHAATGLLPAREAFGTARNNGQFFGHYAYDVGHPGLALEVAFRGSYTQTLCALVAMGANANICDNMMVWGHGTQALRRQTKNARADILPMIDKSINEALPNFEAMVNASERMQSQAVNTNRGYEILGRAVGLGLLNGPQTRIAFEQWRSPKYEAYEPRNLWSLYNAGTEALKKGQAPTMIERHTAWHDFILDEPEPISRSPRRDIGQDLAPGVDPRFSMLELE